MKKADSSCCVIPPPSYSTFIVEDKNNVQLTWGFEDQAITVSVQASILPHPSQPGYKVANLFFYIKTHSKSNMEGFKAAAV